MTIIAIAAHCGGSGKTTTTEKLAQGLADRHIPVIAIDADPQASLTSLAGDGGSQWHTEDLIQGRCDLPQAAVDTGYGWSIVPATINLQATAAWMQLQWVTHDHMATALHAAPDDTVVLIDCPPAADLITFNSLIAADHVLVPVIPEAKGLDGLDNTVDLVQQINTRGLGHAQILGKVITQIDWRTKRHNDYVSILRNAALPVLCEVPMAKGMDASDKLSLAYATLVDHIAAMYYGKVPA